MKHKYIVRGIVIMLVLMLILFCVILATPASAAEPIRTNRQDRLHEAAEILRAAGYADDSEVIKAIQDAWDAEQESLDIIARVVQGEAPYCPWMHQVAVAAVVVNRVNDARFPDTVREVVSQPGQYTTEYLYGFSQSSEQCYLAAKRALDGESGVPEDIVWQAQFPQGKETWWKSYVDTGWFASTTWFCR